MTSCFQDGGHDVISWKGWMATFTRLPELTCKQIAKSDDLYILLWPISNQWYDVLQWHASFSVAGPRLWNNLPVELRQQDICLTKFRRLLKTVLFRWDSAHCDFFALMAPGISTLTYLLTYLQCLSTGILRVAPVACKGSAELNQENRTKCHLWPLYRFM